MEPDPLELATRRRLYAHVVRHPGKYLRELQRELGLAMGELEYHLDYLGSAGLVTVLQDGNKRFFASGIDRREKRVLSLLRQELARRALVVVMRDGPCTKSHLLSELGVAPSTLNYHLAHLTATALVVAGREGRDAVYTAKDPAAIVRLLVSYRSSLLDRVVDGFLDGVDALRTQRPTSQKDEPGGTPHGPP